MAVLESEKIKKEILKLTEKFTKDKARLVEKYQKAKLKETPKKVVKK